MDLSRGAALIVSLVLSLGACADEKEPDAAPPDEPTSPTTASSALAGEEEWRTEYWGDIAVDVPADWGYGAAPMEDPFPGAGETITCSDQRSPSGQLMRHGLANPGFVGRPIFMTDACATELPHPRLPYVWLDAAGVEPGVERYDDGWVQETIEVGTRAVTVGTDDDALRTQILATAHVVEAADAICPQAPMRPQLEWTREGRGEFLSGAVCAYQLVGAEGQEQFVLTYAAPVGEPVAERTFAAVASAPEPGVLCDYQPFEFAMVIAKYRDNYGTRPLVQSVRFDMGCGGTVDDVETIHEITPDSVRPWADGGIRSIVIGPTGGKGAMIDSFLGPQG